MADVDKDQKTEDPTSKRLGETRQKGNVVNSQEVNNLFTIVAITIVIAFFANYVAGGLSDRLTVFLAAPHDIAVDPVSIQSMVVMLGGSLGTLLIVPIGFLMVAAIASNIVQHGWLVSWEKLKPKFKSLNPISGLKNKVSPTAAVDVVKDLVKLMVIGAVVLTVIWPQRERLLDLTTIGLVEILPIVRVMALKVLVAVAVVLALLALLDYLYQRYDYYKKLRMTKQEVKDERKQMEGDPKVKQRIFNIRIQRMRQRMMEAVPQSDVVVTNPTHYAVALKYDSELMEAPKVTAKGRDNIALRIRELAEEHGVPVVENPPLARALEASCEVDQEIPVEHYKAVAEVIGFVMRVHGGLRSARAAARA